MDFQNRVGSRTGGGGLLSGSQSDVARKERLRQLAMETMDISKDPYFLRNHMGQLECKLCLTLHSSEANYMAHTQGKRHQMGIAKRAHMEEKSTTAATNAAQKAALVRTRQAKHVIRIGRPAYKITKARDMMTGQKALTFIIDYPDADSGVQPRHRFMSTFEQKIEPTDRRYQYLIVACNPYENVAFKIPSTPIDRREGQFYTSWDDEGKVFKIRLAFEVKPEPPEQIY